MAIDPVCKMKVCTTKAKGKSVYEGKTYYFCDTKCKDSFDKNPSKYIEKPGKGCCCCKH